jgi:hypothetical protein
VRSVPGRAGKCGFLSVDDHVTCGPWPYPVGHDGDTRGTGDQDPASARAHTAYITFTEPLPPTFAMRTGEALYQLRSVLDHTVMMLSDVSPDSRATEFVIANSPAGSGR